MAEPEAGQDTYHYEAEQERLAELKGMHQPMKIWYAKVGGVKIARWGGFPGFWQELGTWAAYKEVGGRWQCWCVCGCRCWRCWQARTEGRAGQSNRICSQRHRQQRTLSAFVCDIMPTMKLFVFCCLQQQRHFDQVDR
jgi:hypothetical protein